MKNILVVDDSPTMRQMVKGSLSGLPDGSIVEAGNGLEAIGRLAMKPIDLIVLDLNMPGMDGLDVVRYVRGHQDYHDIPIIVLSGGGDDTNLETPLAVGASCCLAKPFDPAELKARVCDLLDANSPENQENTDAPKDTAAFSDFLADYFAECEKHIAVLHRDVLKLQEYEGPATVDTGLLDEVFRSFHTLNGLSGMVGEDEAGQLADKMEKYLRALRQGQDHLDAAGILGLLRGINMLEQVVAARCAKSPSPGIAEVLDELDNLLVRPKPVVAVPPWVASVVNTETPELNSPQSNEDCRITAARKQGTKVWQVVFNSSPELSERGITVTVIRDRLKSCGELIHVAPRAMEGGRIAFEFVLAGNEGAEKVLSSWGTDGVAFTPHVSSEPDAPAETPPQTETIEPPPTQPVNTQESEILKMTNEILDTVVAAGEIEEHNYQPSAKKSFLLFSVEEGRYALDVAAVERAVPAAEVTPLPDAPENVLGLINIAGVVMPVVDIRGRLGFPPRDMELSDRIIVARAAGRPLALLVDKIEGVVEFPECAAADRDDASSHSDSTVGVATMLGGIVLIQDIGDFAAAADISNYSRSQWGTNA